MIDGAARGRNSNIDTINLAGVRGGAHEHPEERHGVQRGGGVLVGALHRLHLQAHVHRHHRVILVLVM